MRMTRKSRRQRQRREKLKKEVISIAKKGFGLTAAAMLFWSTFSAEPANAMPSNGSVAAGNAAIAQHGNVMNILQSSNRAIINWRAFSIAANEIVNFNQPNANAVMLNRVLGTDPSKIFGQMNANGKVFLVNPNGVLFAPGAQVNVGGLLATTHSISDADFMNGNYKFISTNPDGQVINQGTIVAQNQGIVSLLAPEAINEGVIVAQKGTVTIASANQATFDFTGDGKLQLIVDESAVKALAENRGIVEAEGGLVLMTASAHRELGSAVVNQSGIVRATSLGGTSGTVELNAAGGTANLAGTIDVSGAAAGATGGTVDIFAKDITLESSAKIAASGDTGGGTVRIGGDWQGSGDAPHADSVTIANGAVINADAITKGDGGTVVAWSDGVTKFDGTISAKGGQESGNGGKVETSGHILMATGDVNASAANGKAGEWLLDPWNIEIVDFADSNVDWDEILSSGTSYVDVGSINTSLNNSNGSTNVTIETNTSGGSEGGDITVKASISKTQGDDATLTLKAERNIIIENNVQITSSGADTGKLNVDLWADSDGSVTGRVAIGSGAKIATNGGDFIVRGGTNGTGYASSSSGNDHGVNIAGTVNTKGSTNDGSITIYGQSNASGAAYAGVMISGELNSGNGEITIKGSSLNNATGIILSNTGKITGETVNLIADKMSFTGTAGNTYGIFGTTDSVLNINSLTSGTNVSIGGEVSDSSLYSGLYLSSNLFDIINNFSTIDIGSKTDLGTITINSSKSVAIADSDLTLKAKTINIEGTLTASNNTVTLNNTGAGGSNTGLIIAKTLDLLGGETTDFTFGLGNASVENLTAQAHSVTFTNNTTLNINSLTVNGTSAITTTGDINVAGAVNTDDSALDLTATGTITNADNNTINTGGGILNLTASAIDLKSASQINSNNVNFKTDGLSMGAGAAVTGNDSGTFAIDTNTGKTIHLGVDDDYSGDLFISADALAAITRYQDIVVGSVGNTITNTGINVGTATAHANLTLQTNDNITFNDNASLETTSGNDLTLDAGTINFTTTSGAALTSGHDLSLTAGTIDFNSAKLKTGNDLSITADTIDWDGLGSISTNTATNTTSNLYIAHKTTPQLTPMIIGRTSSYVTADALAIIADGDFKNVTIGQNSAGNTTAGNVTIDTFDFTPGSGHTQTNLIIVGGGDATIDGQVTMNSDGYLAFKVKSLSQAINAGNSLTVKRLLLDGKGEGDFKFLNRSNDIGDIAADVGSLTVYNDGANLNVSSIDGINGITTTDSSQTPGGSDGSVTFVTDSLSVDVDKNASVNAEGILTIYSLTKNKIITLGGAKEPGTLSLTSDEVSRLNGSKIVFGDKNLTDFTGNVNIRGKVTFKSDVEIWTKNETDDESGNTGKVTLTGSDAIDDPKDVNTTEGIKIGTAGEKDLTITAYDFSNTSDLWLKNLTLSITKGLTGLGGKVHSSGKSLLTITNPNDAQSGLVDIYIVDTDDPDDPASSPGYTISYNTLNDALEGFDGYRVVGENDIFLDDGTLDTALSLKADNDINVIGDVTIAGDNSYLGAEAGGNFTIDDGKLLKVTGTNAEVEISAENTSLGTNAVIDVESGNFTLSTNKLIGDGITDSTAKIKSSGSLTLQQKTATGASTDTALYVGNNGAGQSGLVITSDQLNGVLFEIGINNLTLGNANSGATVTVDGLTLDNSVTIQTGSGGAINITDDLTVNDSNSSTRSNTLTLKGGTITNNNNSITVTNGTINFYANTLDLTTDALGGATVIGMGSTNTIGISSYDGSHQIYLGSDNGQANTLYLDKVLFEDVLDGFTHYNIGNSNQSKISVNMTGDFTLDQDTTLIAHNIDFDGNMNIAGNTLTIHTVSDTNGRGSSTQTAGVIKADKLALRGDNHTLTAAGNEIGTLAAEARNISVTSKTLTIGDVEILGGETKSGVTGTNVTLHATTTPSQSGATALTVNKNIIGNNVTLIADTMAFPDGGGMVKRTGDTKGGTLTVRQHSTESTMGIGSNTNATLEFGSEFFGGENENPDGIFSQKFETLILGNQNAGLVMNDGVGFGNDNVIIRGQTVTIEESTDITAWSKTFEFQTQKLITKWGYSFDADDSDFIISADEFEFAEDGSGYQKGFFGTGKLTLRTLDSKNRHIYLGNWDGSDTGNGLYLKSKYFDIYGWNKMFGGFDTITVGRKDGEGYLKQDGTVNFYSNLILLQGKGSVTINGKIITNNKNINIESTEVTINGNGKIDAGDNSEITLHADDLTIDGTITSNNGRLFLDIYADTGNIGDSGGLQMEYDWFKKDGAFQGKYGRIDIGSDKTGNVTLNDLTLADDLTDELNVQSGGDIEIYDLNTGDASLDVKAGKNINIKKLTSKKGGTVSAEAGTDGEISITDSEFTLLGRTKAGKGITIKNKGHLTIEGEVTGGEEVDILTKGDLTIGENGSIESGSDSDIYLTAEDGHFINKNEGDSADVLKPGGRWFIFTKNPNGDKYGKLIPDFRRYDTKYGDKASLTNSFYSDGYTYDYGDNGIAYSDPAVIEIYGTNTYGDGYKMFFANGHYHIVFPDGDDRALLDGEFWAWLEQHLLETSVFHIGETLASGKPDVTSKGQYYGTPYVDKPGELYVTYTGPNGLNYTIKIYLTVSPRHIEAVETEKTLNANNNNIVPPGLRSFSFNLPVLEPPTPAQPEADANIVLDSNNSSSKGTLKNEEAGGFALHFDYYENDRGHAGNSRTLGAIPILFAQEGEQRLDAIYVINYNHDNGKLAILPAAQRVTTPKLDEVRPDANHEFAIHYESTPLGLFEVSHGNGIVGIRPVDDMALESLIAGEKSVTKAVLANGILAAIKNISVMPDQIRAVYIFLEK